MQQNRKPDITSTQKDKSYVFCQLKDFSLEKYEDVVLVDCVTPNSPADQSDVRKVRTNQIIVLIVGEYQLQIKCWKCTNMRNETIMYNYVKCV